MPRRIRVRENPTLSFFGGIIALGAVLFGVFVVIPSAGGFGIVWTLVAAAGALMSFYNALSSEGVAKEIIEVEDEPPTEPSSVESRLRLLNDLKVKGLVTPSEYEQRRSAILQEL